MSRALDFQKAIHGADFNHVVDNSNCGHCSCCGECCSDIIPLTVDEINRLKRFVKKNHYKANTKIRVPMTATYDMTCPFLNADNKCDVYAIRPEVCKLFRCWCNATESVEMFESQPKDLQAAFFALYDKHPEVVSVRHVIFGERVPFEV